MNAVLSNPNHPEYGQVTIPLPIPDEEYGHCIELLEQLEIGHATERDCRVDEITGGYATLVGLIGSVINLDELDFLARSIDRYWGNESAKFEAMAYKLGIGDIEGLINLSFGCEQATIITDFSDLNRAGKDHYMDTHGCGAPVDVLEHLNGEKLIRDLIDTGTGSVTPYGVIFDNGMRLEREYTGQNFPVYYDRAYSMEMELAPPPSAPEEALPMTLLLPMPEKRLERLLERGGYHTPEDVRISTWRSELPEQINDCLGIPHVGLTELNRMYQAAEKLKRPDLDRLAAAVLMAKPEYAMQVRHLAENLELFDFIPNIKTPEELGKFMIQKSGHFEYDPNLDGFYDYAKYGEQRVREQAGEFNERGYIGYTGVLSLDELMMEDPAEQYQKEQEEQWIRGGMT